MNSKNQSGSRSAGAHRRGPADFFLFFPNPRKTSIQLLLEAQQHKKYAQTTPLDDGVSSLFSLTLCQQSDVIAVTIASEHGTHISPK
jgi:hypothetical protein